MAKKKEDLGGVWRTVGGRRIFIKDGQDLYEAMNDSGKFTNLKKTNSQRKKNDLNKGDVFVNKNGVKVEIVDVDEKGNTLRKMVQPDGKEDFKNFNEKDVKAMLNQNGYHKEIEYIGQDDKKHKMLSIEYPEDRDSYHKYLTEKYGTYKEEEIKDKYGRTDYKKLREEFYQHQEKASYKVDGKAMSEQDLRKEFDKELERGNIEKGTTYHEWKKGIVDDRNSNVKSEYSKKDTLLAKASKIEEIEAELKQVQSRVWNAENDMADQGIEENRWRENPSYNEDRYRLVYLRRDLEEAKDEYWKEKNKINQKRWEKELNSKPKVDDHDLDKLREIADNYEDESKYDLDDIQKDYIKNRRNEMSYNKRNENFKPNTTQGKIEAVLDQYNNPDRKTATLSDMVKLKIQKDGDRYVIVDETETLGYNGGDKYERRSRERIEKEITEKLRKTFNDDELYLEADVPGRLVIASDKKELGGFETSTRNSIYTDKNGAKIGHSMVVQYATMNHLTIEEAKRILGVK